jgi:ribosomal protein S27AE
MPECVGNPKFNIKHEPIKMQKSGSRLSGHNKRPRWVCPKCGRTTIKTDEIIIYCDKDMEE